MLVKYPPLSGGVATRAMRSASHFVEEGNEVHVVTDAYEADETSRIHLYGADLQISPHFRKALFVHHINPSQTRPIHCAEGVSRVSQLAGLAISIITTHDIDAIYSNYLEPYAVAADIAATSCRIPHVTQHAGSDITALGTMNELLPTYKGIFQRAHTVLTDARSILRLADEWSIDRKKMTIISQQDDPGDNFNPRAVPLDLAELSRSLSMTSSRFCRILSKWNSRPIPEHVLTVGIYGKVGSQKGSRSLVGALASLRDEGFLFNFLAITGGEEVHSFRHSLERLKLQERSWLFPYITNYRIPSFLQLCDVVCCLENDFWVPGHLPATALEALYSGKCLVTSQQIYELLQRRIPTLTENHVAIVPNAVNVESIANTLRNLIQDPDTLNSIIADSWALVGNFPRIRYEADEVYRAVITACAEKTQSIKGSGDQAEMRRKIIEKAMRFPIKDARSRYMKEAGIAHEDVMLYEREMRRFLALCAINPDAHYGVSGKVDDYWHAFILCTREYQAFCHHVAGAYIHHSPLEPNSHSDFRGDGYSRFLADYISIFGHSAPKDIWPRDSWVQIIDVPPNITGIELL